MNATEADPGAIQNISDTARWVAFYRAMESERADAHFRDPWARRLAGERGEAIVDAMPRGRAMAWPMIVRTCLLDEMILRIVREEGADAMLNLAAGLDARPWRLDFPAGFTWYDVDLPGILEYKRGVIGGEPARCAHHAIAADLRDAGARRAVFARVAGAHRRVVVVSEGLIVYLPAADVAALGRDLAAQPAFAWWLTDLASPRLLRFMRGRWSKRLDSGNATMQFAPAEGTAFFAPLGWHEQEFRSIWYESVQLKRTLPMAGFWQFVGRFLGEKRREEWRRFSGVVRLGRPGAPGPLPRG